MTTRGPSPSSASTRMSSSADAADGRASIRRIRHARVAGSTTAGLLEPIRHVPPAEFEAAHSRSHSLPSHATNPASGKPGAVPRGRPMSLGSAVVTAVRIGRRTKSEVPWDHQGAAAVGCMNSPVAWMPRARRVSSLGPERPRSGSGRNSEVRSVFGPIRQSVSWSMSRPCAVSAQMTATAPAIKMTPHSG
jgi:hypothetical protein